MHLLRIADIVINVDLVTDIRLEPGAVVVFLAAPITNDEPLVYQGDAAGIATRAVVFHGEDAAALRRWIERNTEDVMLPPPDARPGFRPPQG